MAVSVSVRSVVMTWMTAFARWAARLASTGERRETPRDDAAGDGPSISCLDEDPAAAAERVQRYAAARRGADSHRDPNG